MRLRMASRQAVNKWQAGKVRKAACWAEGQAGSVTGRRTSKKPGKEQAIRIGKNKRQIG